jgi:serine acetyltransferase
VDDEKGVLRGLSNRLLQGLARFLPGERSIRIFLHRARGVKIGKNVLIGYDVVLETACPHLVSIADGAAISMRATIIAHFKESRGVRIESDAFIGPGVIVLPNVVIGHGAVITAGSVVTSSIPPMTVARGNPAVPIARCGVPLDADVSFLEFSGRMRPLTSKEPVTGEDMKKESSKSAGKEPESPTTFERLGSLDRRSGQSK